MCVSVFDHHLISYNQMVLTEDIYNNSMICMCTYRTHCLIVLLVITDQLCLVVYKV